MSRPAFLLIAAGILLLLPSAVPAGPSDPAAQFARLLPPHARWALVVLDAESGRERVSWGNARGEPLIPGSLQKLVTCGAVLDAVSKGEASPETFTGREGEPRLDRYLRRMNVHSVNRMAERLFLRLGRLRFGRPATREKGTRAIGRYLAGLGFPPHAFRVYDGSGLSRRNRVTAGAMARYLQRIGRRSWFPRLLASLPRAGMEGTVREIGYVDERFRVKSGHLDGMFALAGYGIDRDGRRIVFAFIVNAPGRGSDRRHSRGRLVEILAREELPP